MIHTSYDMKLKLSCVICIHGALSGHEEHIPIVERQVQRLQLAEVTTPSIELEKLV